MELKEPLLQQEYPQNPSVSKRNDILICAISISIIGMFILIMAQSGNDQQTIVLRVEDKRQFEIYSLNNGFEALIIHNSTTPQNLSFVSISLPVGLMHDGDIQGLAHLVQELSVCQSQKYQTQNNLFSFVQQKGGSFDAYTSFQETNYHYQIKNDSLKQSLDILGSFLLEPSLQEQDIIKQVNVIEEE